MDYSPPGSSILGIFQARILELVAISSSRGSSQPRDRTPGSCVSCIAGRVLTCWGTGKAPLKYLLDLMVSASEDVASSLTLWLPAQQLFLGSLHTVYTGLPCGLRVLLPLLLLESLSSSAPPSVPSSSQMAGPLLPACCSSALLSLPTPDRTFSRSLLGCLTCN